MTGILTPKEIETLLQTGRLGRIGCRNGDDIYIVPVSFYYAENSVLCHSYEGQKTEWMRQYNKVCFEVEQITDKQNWKCVIAQGIVEELNDEQSIKAAAELLGGELSIVKKATLSPEPPAEENHTPVQPQRQLIYYRIHFNTVSGRFEKSI